MTVIASVQRSSSESTPSLIRRFSKRVQGSGVIRRAKSIRYHSRAVSKTKRRTGALRRLKRTLDREYKERLGLVVVKTRGRGRR